MNGNENQVSRRSLLGEVRTATFNCVEANLFLDTHPCNKEALRALYEYEAKRKKAVKKYEEYVGPLFAYSVGENDRYYEWVKEPFPWEKEDK